MTQWFAWPRVFVPQLVSVLDVQLTSHHEPLHVAGAVQSEATVQGSPTPETIVPASAARAQYEAEVLVGVQVVPGYAEQSSGTVQPGTHDFDPPVPPAT